MILRPPISTRTDTLFPYTTLFRSASPIARDYSMVCLTSDYLRGCNMNWRSGCASVALIFIAQGAQAQPVGYEEALRAARLNQPVLQARELEVEALRSTAEAADELPDPRLRVGIVNLQTGRAHV